MFDAPVIVEDPSFPAMKAFPLSFTIKDEIYLHESPYSREKLRVLARLDPSKLDLKTTRGGGVRRTDNDFPIAWAKMYGKGRVCYSTFGHGRETWDNPEIQMMYFEAIKWAMGLTNGLQRNGAKPETNLDRMYAVMFTTVSSLMCNSETGVVADLGLQRIFWRRWGFASVPPSSVKFAGT